MCIPIDRSTTSKIYFMSQEETTITTTEKRCRRNSYPICFIFSGEKKKMKKVICDMHSPQTEELISRQSTLHIERNVRAEYICLYRDDYLPQKLDCGYILLKRIPILKTESLRRMMCGLIIV